MEITGKFELFPSHIKYASVPLFSQYRQTQNIGRIAANWCNLHKAVLLDDFAIKKVRPWYTISFCFCCSHLFTIATA